MPQVSLNKKINNRGITLIEVAIGVTILSLTVLLSIFTMSQFIELRKETQQKTKALYLAEEGQEILRYLRDEDWHTFGTDLSVETRYFLHASSTYVATTTVPEIIDGQYHREFMLYEVNRDNTSDDIVSSTTGSSYDDSNAFEVVVRVGYGEGSGTTTLRSILTNIFDI